MASSPDADRLIDALVAAREAPCFPSAIRSGARSFAGQVMGVLFPHFAPEVRCSHEAVRADLALLEESLRELCGALASQVGPVPAGVVEGFFRQLEAIHGLLRQDALALFESDPAASSVDEIILTYPGFYATSIYRVAHALHRLGLPLLPRLLTEFAHRETGVDIHPGAQIGRRFVIDHGTGVVIGETTVIGNGVKLYQGVTLGALVVNKELARQKRHPTLEDNVVVYSGATILGGQTVVGHDSVVAGNAWLTQSVPPFSVVGRKSDVRPRSGPDEPLDFNI